MRSRLTFVPLAAAILACGGSSDSTAPGTGGGGGGGGTTPVATTSVSMVSSAFSPRAIRVSPGAVVTWTNADVGTPHNVTFTAAASSIKTSDFTSGTASLTMPTVAGSYPYSCTIHSGMTGSVQVQ
jgi:plastocyanin